MDPWCCWPSAGLLRGDVHLLTWYLLECLYADRKDRSVLFWKSLPIPDTDTVLAKLFAGAIAIPLVYFIAADISTLLMAFIISIRAHAYAGLWRPDRGCSCRFCGFT